ncbi:MAG: hypothetical protein GXP15_07170 [Gammaproteobacteria bacterium]|nr:hypothetical protein [Gammaproteobacteria bacterium]
MDENRLDKALEESFSDTRAVFTEHVNDPAKYIEDAIRSIRKCKCEPFVIKATVLEPGLEGKTPGDTIQGYCVAKSNGYWLVYEPKEGTFYCFRGTSVENLGVRGIVGGALECWLA